MTLTKERLEELLRELDLLKDLPGETDIDREIFLNRCNDLVDIYDEDMSELAKQGASPINSKD